jgi:hypothetical protein
MLSLTSTPLAIRSQSAPTDYDILADELSNLCRDLKECILELPIAQEASKGRPFAHEAEWLLTEDVKEIVKAFATANAGTTHEMLCLFYRVWQRLTDTYSAEVKPFHFDQALSEQSDGKFALPFTLVCLRTFDRKHGTQHAVRLAQFFLKLVSTLSLLCDSQFVAARQYVQKKYVALLTPDATQYNASAKDAKSEEIIPATDAEISLVAAFQSAAEATRRAAELLNHAPARLMGDVANVIRSVAYADIVPITTHHGRILKLVGQVVDPEIANKSSVWVSTRVLTIGTSEVDCLVEPNSLRAFANVSSSDDIAHAKSLRRAFMSLVSICANGASGVVQKYEDVIDKCMPNASR